jgi:hypothetical protein
MHLHLQGSIDGLGTISEYPFALMAAGIFRVISGLPEHATKKLAAPFGVSINIMLFSCRRHFPPFLRAESTAYGQFNSQKEKPSQERPTMDRASMYLGGENAQGMCQPIKGDPKSPM